MVEDVHITGSDIQWATERTQEQILKSMQEAFKLDSTQTKRVADTLEKVRKEGSIDAGKAKKAMSALTSDLMKTSKEAAETAAGFEKLEKGPLKNFGRALKESSGAFKTTALGVGFLGAQAGAAIAAYQSTVDVLRSLTDMGVMYEGSHLSIQETLAKTGLSLEQFNEISQKYARVIGQNSLKALNKLVQSTAHLTGGFDSLGLTTADAVEYASEYLDQQRIAGLFQQASARGQNEALKTNIERLTSYSKILNVSRQQLQEETREMLGRRDLQAKFFSLEENERKRAIDAYQKTAQAFSATDNKEFLDIFTDIAASPIAEASEGYKIIAQTSPVLARKFVEMSDQLSNGLAPTADELIRLFEQTAAATPIEAFRLAGGEVKNTAELIAFAGKNSREAAASMDELRRKFIKQGGDITNESEFQAYLKSVDKNAEGATSLADGINKVLASIDRLRVEGLDKLVKSFVGEQGIASVTDTIGNQLRSIAGWLNEIVDGPNPLEKIMDFATSALSGVIQTVGNLLVAAIQKGFAMLSENSIIGKAQAGVTGALDYVSGTSRRAEYNMLSPEQKAAEDRKRFYSKPGGPLGFSAAQIKRSISEATTSSSSSPSPSTSSAPVAVQTDPDAVRDRKETNRLLKKIAENSSGQILGQ